MQLLLSIIVYSSLLTVLSLGITELYAILRFFHLAHAMTLTLGAYFVYVMLIPLGWPLWVSVLLSVVTVILLMMAVNKWIYQPSQDCGAESWELMIASLGLYVVLQNLVSIFCGDRTLSFRTWEIKAGNPFLGAQITSVQIITIITCAVLIIGLWLFLHRTNIGKQIKAASSNPELSTVLGVSRGRIVRWTMAICTGIAACTGILIAADMALTPTMGFNWLLCAVVVMIISGMGKEWHLILGALLLATAQVLVAYFFDSKWMNATAYIILVIFLYFRPYGFSGKKLKKTEI